MNFNQINKIKDLLNKKEKITISFLFILMFLNSLMEILSIGILIPLITLFFEGNDASTFSNILYFDEIFNNLFISQDIRKILILIVLIFTTKNLFIIFYNYFLGRTAMNIRLRLVNGLYKKYLSQNYEFFLSKNTAEIIRNINEAQYFSVVMISYLTFFLEILIVFLLTLFLVLVNFKVTLPVIACLVTAVLLINKFSKIKLLNWGLLRQKYQKDINQNIFENFLNVKEIKILNKEKFFSNKLINIDKSLANIEFKTDILLQFPRVIIEVLSITLICFVIFISLNFFSLNEIVILVSIYAASVVRLMPSATRISASIQRIVFFKPLVNLMSKEFKLKLKNSIYKDTKYLTNFNSLKLSNVSFNYKKSNNILSNINLEINKNTISCFVGKNGSGKTTLINIISGLLKPITGKVFYNENSKLNKVSLKFGYVAQNINLIDDTIKNNIIFGNDIEKFDKENFINSIEHSGINDFIEKLPKKFNTFVGDRGIKISGGQSQRIGIARAIYNNPDILILDEFNSNLDMLSEKKIIKNLNKLKKNKTILIITHKKSIIKFCDNAFLIKDKKLIKIK
jgi:ABC-type bacteriocin/lantibiotic exporter with double-glycine peptidase domain